MAAQNKKDASADIALAIQAEIERLQQTYAEMKHALRDCDSSNRLNAEIKLRAVHIRLTDLKRNLETLKRSPT